METLRQGEDNTEHRQTGKNNMYDSGSRVAMILSGPGIKAMQEMEAGHQTSSGSVSQKPILTLSVLHSARSEAIGNS